MVNFSEFNHKLNNAILLFLKTLIMFVVLSSMAKNNIYVTVCDKKQIVLDYFSVIFFVCRLSIKRPTSVIQKSVFMRSIKYFDYDFHCWEEKTHL